MAGGTLAAMATLGIAKMAVNVLSFRMLGVFSSLFFRDAG